MLFEVLFLVVQEKLFPGCNVAHGLVIQDSILHNSVQVVIEAMVDVEGVSQHVGQRQSIITAPGGHTCYEP